MNIGVFVLCVGVLEVSFRVRKISFSSALVHFTYVGLCNGDDEISH
jgi:hypothetical protein